MNLVRHAFCSLVIVLIAVSTYAQRSFVYTNNSSSPFNTISAFSVEADGRLTTVSGSPFPSGGALSGGEATPQTTIWGNFLYASNGNDISAFSINPNSGILTPVAGSPFPTGAMPQKVSLAATPDGRFLYGGYSLSRSIHGFGIGSDGSLSEITRFDFPAFEVPVGVAVSPNGRFLAVTGRRGSGPFPVGAIWVLAINPNGTLSLVSGSPFPDGTPEIGCCGGGEPTGAQFNRASNLLYVGESNIGATIVDIFSVASNGALTPIPGSPFRSGIFLGAGENSRFVLLSPNERFLFVSNQSTQSITALSVASNGSLTPVPGSPFGPGLGFPQEMAVDRNGPFLFAANIGLFGFPGDPFNAVTSFKVGSNGALTLVDRFSTGTCCGLASVVAYPSGPFFDFCIKDDSTSSILRINSTTGDYLFTNCSGFTLSGTALLIKRGGIITLQQFGGDRRVFARIDTSVNKGTASIQLLSTSTTFTITDRSTANDTCVCSAK